MLRDTRVKKTCKPNRDPLEAGEEKVSGGLQDTPNSRICLAATKALGDKDDCLNCVQEEAEEANSLALAGLFRVETWNEKAASLWETET